MRIGDGQFAFGQLREKAKGAVVGHNGVGRAREAFCRIRVDQMLAQADEQIALLYFARQHCRETIRKFTFCLYQFLDPLRIDQYRRVVIRLRIRHNRLTA